MKKFVIGLIIILAVIVIGVGGYFLLNNLNNSNDTHSNKTTKSSTENSQTKEDENKEKITKIIGVKELEEDIVGKYTTKMEVTFLDGKFTTIKASFYDIKDDYILQTLKANYDKSDIADKIVIGDKSFSYELTAEEYGKYLKNPDVLTLVTRNYIYSNLKKNGYTVTVEGDDSFLGDNNQTSEETEKSTQNETIITKKEVEEDIDKMKNGTEQDAEEIRQKYEDKAREELNKRGYDYDQMKEDAQRKADELRRQYGY